DGRSSRYFENIVSFPFVPGHEVVARPAGDSQGSRVVIEPVLGCAARGIAVQCDQCREGNTGNCSNLSMGNLSAGLQTGYCCDTGGGWGSKLVAHRSQVHEVPREFSNRAAVMVEPAACGTHAALSAGISDGDTVTIIGAGTLGLTTLAAVRRWTSPSTIIVGAKYPHQRNFAADLGADTVVAPDEVLRATRRSTGTMAFGDGATSISSNSRIQTASSGTSHSRRVARRLGGGADVVIDCVGNSESLETALSIVRPRGRVVVVGMPGSVKLDLAPLWHREITMVGAYAYGQERFSGPARRTFDLAFELVAACGLERLVTAIYPLERYEEAVAHAALAGPRGAIKIAFDPAPALKKGTP
ncbi:MAG TPA: zinc-binding dehydrogenase, partial [Acidimicrobiales bacterium]|nr:zinc-binding dehydrogenase [Acidimicrobiales bacterium]